MGRIFKWLLGLAFFLSKQSKEESAQELKTIEVAPVKPKRKRRVSSVNEDDLTGKICALDGLLDRLDDYFFYIKKFKKHDPESYQLYSKVGGQIFNQKAWLENANFDLDQIGWKSRKEKPGFGLIHFVDEDLKIYTHKHEASWKFIYFRKFEKLWNIQRTNSHIYEVCVFYSRPNSEQVKFAVNFYVGVDDDGNVSSLREKVGSKVHIKGKRGEFSFTRQEWQKSPFLKFTKEEHPEYKSEEDIARYIFCGLMNSAMLASSGVQVRCKKGGLAAIFDIDMLKTPYFFKDRDKSVTVNGKTKKIFHIVRAHKRVMPDGSEKVIKSHFRGEQKFKWHNYDVNITMPGLHHASLSDFTFACVDVETLESEKDPRLESKQLIDNTQLGEQLSKHIEGKR